MQEEVSFFGREPELARLGAALRRSLQGDGQTVFVEGDAGSGKSALIEAFVALAQTESDAVLATLATCDSQTGQSDAYLPFIETLAQLTGDADEFQSDAVSETNAGRISAFVSVATKTIVEETPNLLGSLIPGGSFIFNAARFSAEKAGWVDKLESAKKQAKLEGSIDSERIFQLYTDLLLRFSDSVPLILIVDDLHWVDSASAQLLFHLSRRVAKSRILLIGAYRPHDLQLKRGEERHPMAPILNELKRVHGDIVISLGDEQETDRKALVDALIDATPNRLDDAFRQRFFEHTRGYPLFAQELLRSLKERGDLTLDDSQHWVPAGGIDWHNIPPRVEGVIEERIARLNDDYQELLSIASVQGETFVAGVVAKLLELPERKVLRTLSRDLAGRHGLVHEVSSIRVGGNQVSVFRFSHNLFRQYLYHELGGGERMALHAEVGELLEEIYAGREADVAAQLAYHFATAQEWAQAVPYYLAAARRMQMLGAYADALESLQTALVHVDALDASRRDPLSLEILITMGSIHQALKGYTHPDVEAVFSSACELDDASLDPVHRAAALYGLWTLKLFNLELPELRRLARDIEAIGDREDNALVKVIAYRAIANTQYQLGNLDETVRYANLVIAHYDPAQAPDYLQQLTYDPKVFSLGLRAWSESLKGDHDAARATQAQMFAWADELDHAASRCVAYLVSLELNHNLHDYAAIETDANAMQTLAAEYRFAWYQAFAELFQNWTLARDPTHPKSAESLSAMRRTYHEDLAPDGNLLVHSQYSRMLAEALQAHGETSEALSVIVHATEVSRSKGEGVYLDLMDQKRAELEQA